MQRSSTAKKEPNQLLRYRTRFQSPTMDDQCPCDVFINHCGIDTKQNVAVLLYDHLRRLRLRPFLDSKSMKPGDKLFEKIEAAIRKCKVGVAIFSPQYCDSYFCLHELALMAECKKKVIPIFCDVKPSDLALKDSIYPKNDTDKFRLALQEAKFTVGLTFDTMNADWSELLKSVAKAVMKNLMEVERDQFIKANTKTGAPFRSKENPIILCR